MERTTTRALRVGVLLLLVAGCAETRRDAVPDDPLQREAADPLTAVTVSSPDGVLLAQVLSTATASIRLDEGDYVIEAPIGGSAPMACIVSLRAVPIATAMAEQYANLNADPADRRLLRIEPTALGDRPSLYVEMGFLQHTTEGTSLGMHKVEGVAIGGWATVLCSQNDVGYRESFRRSVATLVGSLRLTEDPAAATAALRNAVPSYQYIEVTRAVSTPLGISEHRDFQAADGTASFQRSAMLVPHDTPLVLDGIDIVSLETAGRDGMVQTAFVSRIALSDGTRHDDHSQLARHGAGYRVTSGAGAPTAISSAGPLPSGLARQRRVRDALLTGTSDSLTMPVWSPPALHWEDLHYRRLPADGDTRRVERTGAGVARILFYDPSGCWVREESTNDNVSWNSERIFSHGSCTTP